VFGDKKATGVQDQNAQIGTAIDFFRAVCAEHSRPDNHRVKGHAAVVDCLIPGVANIATQDIDREGGLLNLYRLIRFD
jgi:hypothetical protein